MWQKWIDEVQTAYSGHADRPFRSVPITDPGKACRRPGPVPAGSRLLCSRTFSRAKVCSSADQRLGRRGESLARPAGNHDRRQTIARRSDWASSLAAALAERTFLGRYSCVAGRGGMWRMLTRQAAAS